MAKVSREVGWLLAGVLAAGASSGSVAQNAAPAPAYNPTNPQPTPAEAPPSVEVSADHRVTFRISAPQASSVTVNGDFMFGKGPATLTKGADGIWSYTTEPIPPDSYTYNFTVDGVGVLDTRSQNFKETPNSLFNFFDMPGPETDFMALKDVPHGRVEAVIYHSASLNVERRAHVYLPPGFESMHGKLPVLYLLHGVGDNDISWTSAGKVPLILDNLYAAGRIKPMIVVMPSGHVPGSPAGRRLLAPGTDDGFSKDFLNDLVPYVVKTYPVSTRREDTAIAGFSMGGVQTLNLALFHPEMFDYVFPISTGYFPEGVKLLDTQDADALKRVAAHPFKQFYFGTGRADTLMGNNTTATLAALEKYNIPHRYEQLDGGHSFTFARKFLLEAFPLMFR